MKLFCPKCEKPNEINYASRYCVFKCSGCGFKYQGIRAKEESVLKIIFRKLFTLDSTVHDMSVTACPYCFSRIPVYDGYDGLNCRHCTRFIYTGPIEQDEPPTQSQALVQQTKPVRSSNRTQSLVDKFKG